MLQPVAPEAFFESPAGQEYEATFSGPSVPFRNGWEPERDSVARWQTGNYDPDTGRCTLYRGVDKPRLDDFLEHGAITSRVVELFGNYSTQTAIDGLEQAVQGNPPERISNYLENRVNQFNRLLYATNWAPSSLASFEEQRDRFIAFLEGQSVPEVAQNFEDTAQLLSKAQALGKEAYVAASIEARKDITPPPKNWISHSYFNEMILHSSIHLTACKSFVENNQYPHMLKVEFEPGSIPAAPALGHDGERYLVEGLEFDKESGRLTTTDYMSISCSDEEEWYGVGQIAVSDKVDITPIKL